MNVQHAPTAMTESHEQLSYARLHGRWMVLGRGAWITLVILTLGIFFASFPVYLAQLHTLCAGTDCSGWQLTPEQAKMLSGVGWSLDAYAALLVALTLITGVLCLLLSTLIIWRRPDDRMALLVALLLVSFGTALATDIVSAARDSFWQVPNKGLNSLWLFLIVLVFSLFPSGQFVPRWTRWPLVVCLAGLIPYTFFPTNLPPHHLGLLLLLGGAAFLAVAQLYRYRRVSRPFERQQTKWVVFGFIAPAAVYVGVSVLAALFPVLHDANSPAGAPYQLALSAVGSYLTLSFPLSLGVAMLRYRLWEIDVLINRTLVYGALTLILTGVYVGLVIGLQALLRGIISQDSGVAIVISTLIIAALFHPLRRRIQAIIDRRFYRRKYDVAKTLEAFSATLRNEVELTQLREHLLGIVQETMQPAHVSLWLRPSGTRQKTAGPFQSHSSGFL